MMNQPSLAYRRNTQAIWEGKSPEKYTRILPHIPKGATRILELGAAEGVLSLLMAERGYIVTGVELRLDRYVEAIRLQKHWADDLGRSSVNSASFVCGDILNHPALLAEVDTIVAVRAIYYLRDKAADFIKATARAGVVNWIMCGNRNRAATYAACEGVSSDPFMPYNYYASVGGMSKLLTDAGYQVTYSSSDGDPIVVGRLANVKHC